MVSEKISILAMLMLLTTYTSETWGAPSSYDHNHQSHNRQDCKCSGNSAPPKDVKAKPETNIFIDLPTPEEGMNDELEFKVAPNIGPQENNYRFNFDTPSHYKINEMDVPRHTDNISKYSQAIPFDASLTQQGTGQFSLEYPQVFPPAIPSMHQEAKQFNLPIFPPVVPRLIPSKQQGTGQFNQWMLDQMEQFQGRDQIDFGSLGNYILQILQDNGMYVSGSGTLTDSYGTIVDIHSLGLIPILVGNKVPLENWLQPDLHSSQVQLPYSQVILVTTSHPQKILGVLPLGKVYLPFSTMSILDNSWKAIPKVMVSKPKHDLLGIPYNGSEEITRSNEKQHGKVNPERLTDENSGDLTNKKIQKQPQENNSGKSKETSKRKKNKEQERQVSYQPSNFINVNGNENNIGQRVARPGFEPNKDMTDNSYSKKLNSLNFGLKFNDQPINKIVEGRSHEIPLDVVVKSHHYPARIQIPNPTSDVDISLMNDNVLNGIVISQNGVESREFRNTGVPISSVVEIHSDPIKTLEKLSRIDMSLRRKDTPIATIPVPQNSKDNVHVFEILERHVPTRNKDAMLFDVSHSKPRNQNIEGLIFPEQSDFMSRSGVNITEETENTTGKDGNEVFDFLVGIDGEDDDDDDGDFRIIGGNAATGSGTPLSNKGRSGLLL